MAMLQKKRDRIENEPAKKVWILHNRANNFFKFIQSIMQFI